MPLRIFLVEDAPLLRGRVEALLSAQSILKVTGVAASEAEAIEKLQSVPFDVLIVDVALRPGNGLAVLRAARAMRADQRDAQRLWVVVLTNYDLPAIRELCVLAGADFFLSKTREMDQLTPILAQIAAGTH